MAAEVLIVGQGLAGSLLGWAFERAGVSFAIADSGHAGAASAVAAGIINPVAGRRLVKAWRVDELLPLARTTYREIGDALAAPVWHEVRIRRWFADERERTVCAAKFGSGALAPFVREFDAEGCWIDGAGRVDLPLLLAGLRQRWRRQARLREEEVDPLAALAEYSRVIDCRGLAGARDERLGSVPWAYSKGEVLRVASSGLDPQVIQNQRHWVAPIDGENAWVGATHEPGKCDRHLTATAREVLESSAARLLGGAVTVTDHRAGVRVNLPDKLPAMGLRPESPRLGLCNGLGSKGALWAPMLAQLWVRRLRTDFGLTHEWDLGRFARGWGSVVAM